MQYRASPAGGGQSGALGVAAGGTGFPPLPLGEAEMCREVDTECELAGGERECERRVERGEAGEDWPCTRTVSPIWALERSGVPYLSFETTPGRFCSGRRCWRSRAAELRSDNCPSPPAL